MPVSNDNQDYQNPENKNQSNGQETVKKEEKTPEAENQLTSDDLKGKKIDADLTQEKDKPADQ